MNPPFDTNLFDCATIFAIKAHRGTERRGKGFPYIIHPLEAAAIVATISNDAELLAAAVLHDTVEDTVASIEVIESIFGARVASLVMNDTGTKDRTLTWRERKQIQIDKIANGNRDGKIVAIGDKLSNMRAIANDYLQIGDALWSRFHAPGGKSDIAWYYRSLAQALAELCDTLAYQEFTRLIDSTFGLG